MDREDGRFVSAVVVAAGQGTRMGMDINKQYLNISGKPVLARTLEAFEFTEEIKEIILVVNEKDIIYCKQKIVEKYRFTKVKALVCGGETRQISVYRGLCEVAPGCDIVLIHDGARPFVSENEILSCIDTAYEFGACTIATPVKDTIKLADSELCISKTLDRSMLWAVQTPQAFLHSLIMAAHRKALEDTFNGTDDAMLVERMDVRVKLVKGSYDNIKITTKEDIKLAEIIAERNEDIT
ncbi:MAG: 2-C-methyl-D-erythritol 4-phosphate cytidylyltransferase [Bacillota bacterium]|nr:2-C-methyl-D-erythritol 4-phosphate cytidylyltransferase [Bacillota bacterium]